MQKAICVKCKEELSVYRLDSSHQFDNIFVYVCDNKECERFLLNTQPLYQEINELNL